MAVTILSESYGPRKPLITCTADSLDDLAGLVCAEGSTATVGGTEYTLDRVNGWVVPGSGGGGSGVLVVTETEVSNGAKGEAKGPVQTQYSLDKTAGEIYSSLHNGAVSVIEEAESDGVTTTTLRTVSVCDYGEASGYVFTVGSRTYYADTASDYPIT